MSHRLEQRVGILPGPDPQTQPPRGEHQPAGGGAQAGRACEHTDWARHGAVVHVPAGSRVPLVSAGLPVLQALDVGRHPDLLVRGHGVLGQQAGDLGQRRVLELLQPGGQQVVDKLGGLLRRTVEEPLEDQHRVGVLPLLLNLTLVGEQVVAQVHPVGERVRQDVDRPCPGDAVGDLRADGVLDEVGRPRRPADPPPHLHVLDRVGDPTAVDVVQLPHRLHHQVVRADGETLPPAVRHRRYRALPQVLQPRLGRVRRFRRRLALRGHEQFEAVEVRLRPGKVTGVFEVLEEMVVEEEHPDVPVGDQIQGGAVAVRMGIGAHQRVIHPGQRRVVPDDTATGLGRLKHAHLPGPGRAVFAGTLQMRIDPGWIRHVEVRQSESLHDRAYSPDGLRTRASGSARKE